MNKRSLLFIPFLIIIAIASGCGKDSKQMQKVVIPETQADGNYGAETIISDEQTLNDLESMFRKIKWEKATPSMVRKEDVLTMVTYKGKEQEVEYNIWLNEDGTATFLSSDKDESYGILNKDDSKSLQKLLAYKYNETKRHSDW